MPSVEPNTGLELVTLRSRTELRSRVRWLTLSCPDVSIHLEIREFASGELQRPGVGNQDLIPDGSAPSPRPTSVPTFSTQPPAVRSLH